MKPELLNSIEELAYLLFTPGEIAISLQLDKDEFLEKINQPTEDINQAFYKGYLRQLSELRIEIIKAARNGSNPAQLELIKCLQSLHREISHA